MTPWTGEIVLSITCLGEKKGPGQKEERRKESALSGAQIGICKTARSVGVMNQEFGCMWGIITEPLLTQSSQSSAFLSYPLPLTAKHDSQPLLWGVSGRVCTLQISVIKPLTSSLESNQLSRALGRWQGWGEERQRNPAKPL